MPLCGIPRTSASAVKTQVAETSAKCNAGNFVCTISNISQGPATAAVSEPLHRRNPPVLPRQHNRPRQQQRPWEIARPDREQVIPAGYPVCPSNSRSALRSIAARRRIECMINPGDRCSTSIIHGITMIAIIAVAANMYLARGTGVPPVRFPRATFFQLTNIQQPSSPAPPAPPAPSSTPPFQKPRPGVITTTQPHSTLAARINNHKHICPTVTFHNSNIPSVKRHLPRRHRQAAFVPKINAVHPARPRNPRRAARNTTPSHNVAVIRTKPTGTSPRMHRPPAAFGARPLTPVSNT